MGKESGHMASVWDKKLGWSQDMAGDCSLPEPLGRRVGLDQIIGLIESLEPAVGC